MRIVPFSRLLSVFFILFFYIDTVFSCDSDSFFVTQEPLNKDVFFHSGLEKWAWLTKMSVQLKPWFPNYEERIRFLTTVYYESVRQGLYPELILAMVQVESNFKKYAVSSQGALGYMQVRPFWIPLIGKKTDNLFDTKTSIHYGCHILRHYMDAEGGNVLDALQRYNGRVGDRRYSYKVLKKWRKFLS